MTEKEIANNLINYFFERGARVGKAEFDHILEILAQVRAEDKAKALECLPMKSLRYYQRPNSGKPMVLANYYGKMEARAEIRTALEKAFE